MRPNDTILGPFVVMAPWLRALQQAVADDDFAIPGAEIPPISAINEVISMRDSTAPETQEDRSSLQRDLGKSLEMLGPDLEAEVQTAVSEFRRTTLSELPELLRTREGMEVAAASAELLGERIRADEPTKAAWRDVVCAFRADLAYDTCLKKLAILREIVLARGHAWITEARRISEIINDIPQIAMGEGGRFTSPDSGSDVAGLSEDARISLIETDLIRPAGDKEIAVWLLISDAVIGDGTLDCGPVRFFDVRFMRSRLNHAPIDPRPFGFEGARVSFFASRLTEAVEPDEQAVFARVPSRGTAANAVASAREIVAGLLDVATLGVQRPGWKLESGYLVTGEDGASLRRFRLKDDPLERFWHRPDYDLSRVDPDLAAAWAAGDRAAEEAVELARWDKALDLASNEAFRMALGVRNLERVLPNARLVRRGQPTSHWRNIASFYLKEPWCWRMLRRELDEATFYASTPSHENDFHTEDDLDTFYANFRQFANPNDFSARDFVENANAISALFQPGSSRERLITALASKTRSPEAALEWLGELGRDFDALLARAARQRNATVHGSVTVPAIVGGLLPFVSDLGKQVVETALAAAAQSRPRILAFETARLEAIEMTNRIQNGAALASLI